MIRSFADKETESLFATGKSRRLPPDILRRTMTRLSQLNFARRIEDFRNPASNRLEALKGDRSDQWRVCFRFEDSDAFDVEIADYH